jgi:hypothetical protein
MPVMLERWNDDRMDALEAKVGTGFERVDADLSEMRREMKAGFDRIQRLMIQFSGSLVVALIAALLVRG